MNSEILIKDMSSYDIIYKFVTGFCSEIEKSDLDEHLHYGEEDIAFDGMVYLVSNKNILISENIFSEIKNLGEKYHAQFPNEYAKYKSLLHLVVSDEEYARLQKEQNTQYPVKKDLKDDEKAE